MRERKGSNLKEIFLIIVLLTLPMQAGCGRELSAEQETEICEINDTEDIATEKAYKLPVPVEKEKQAETDCKKWYAMMEKQLSDFTQGERMEEIALSDNEAVELQQILAATGNPTVYRETVSNLANPEQFYEFIEQCEQGSMAEVTVIKLNQNAGLTRNEFFFDGNRMFLMNTRTLWNPETKEAVILDTVYGQILEWNYYDSGWFYYEMAVPEEPEVTEVVNGKQMIRIAPLKAEYRELANEYLLPIGYLGNNLFSCNWNNVELDEIDYNGLFEYLYLLDTGEVAKFEELEDNISADRFESLMMKYLPVTVNDLRNLAVYDKNQNRYLWKKLGCGTYSPNDLGNCFPEIEELKENDDGSITLTIHAGCENEGVDDLFTHELTIKIGEDGICKYLSNRIKENEMERIPEYQFRVK